MIARVPADDQIDWVIDAYTRGVVADEQMAALPPHGDFPQRDESSRDSPMGERDDMMIGRAHGLQFASAPHSR